MKFVKFPVTFRLRIEFSPESTDVGIECWSSRTNRNILSPAGRKPSLSASITMPSPAAGTKHKRPKIIAISVRRPILELPGPGPANETWKAEFIKILPKTWSNNHETSI